MPKRRRIILCVAFLSLPLIPFCLHLWLSAGPLRRAVLSRISEAYDGPVEIDRVALRFGGGLVLKGIKIGPRAGTQQGFTCGIPRIDVYGSIWELIGGEFHPTSITIRKPTIQLWQSADGEWFSGLSPQSLAANSGAIATPIQVVGAQLELHFHDSAVGRFTRNISGISLNIAASDSNGDIKFRGKVDDPLWHDWSFSGRGSIRTRQFKCRLQSLPFELQKSHLDWAGSSLVETWQQFQPKGKLAVDASIALNPDSEGRFEYQVLLDPRDMNVHIPTLPDPVENLTGRVEVTPDTIRVHGLVGSLATGEILISGTSTRNRSPEFNLIAEVRRLPLVKLFGEEFSVALMAENDLTGTIHLHGQREFETWSGSFVGSLLQTQRQHNQSIPLNIAIENGRLKLTDILLKFAGGQIVVNAQTLIQKNALIEGTVELKDIQLQSLFSIAKFELEVDGVLVGSLSFRVPMNQWNEPRSWKLSGPIQVREARSGQVEVEWLNGDMSYQNELLVIQHATASAAGKTLSGDFSLALVTPYSLNAQFQMNPVSLTDFAPLDPTSTHKPAVQGQLRVAGKLTGQLQPWSIQLGGTGSLSTCSVGGQRIGDSSFKYQMVGDGINVSGLELNAFDGRLRAGGRWSWAASRVDPPSRPVTKSKVDHPPADRLTLSGDYERVDSATLLRALGSTDAGIEGRAKGRFQFEFAPKTSSQPERLQFTSAIEFKTVRLAGLDTENVKAQLRISDDSFSVPEFVAQSPAGRLSGSARAENTAAGKVILAQVSSAKLSLEELIPWLGGVSDPSSPKGIVSGQLSIRWDPKEDSLSCQGSGRASPLVIDGLPAIDQVVAKQVEIKNGKIVLRDYQANLWGGSARGIATIDLNDAASRIVEVSIEQAQDIELTRLLEAWPASAGRPVGKLSGAGTFYVPGQQSAGAILGTAEFDLDSAIIAGLPVNRAEGTIEVWNAATHELASGRVQPRRANGSPKGNDPRILIKIRDSRAARGSMRGNISVHMNRPITYDTNLQFNGLDLATVARSLFGSPHAIAGSLTGELRLHSTERGMADATAEMRLRLQNANLWPFPLFAVLAKVLSLDPTKSAAFHTADVRRATLQNGVFDFPEFWLASDVAKLFGQGTIGMDGRLNLEIVSNVDTGVTRGMPVLGSLQNLLNNFQRRLIKLRVTGTLDDPMAVPVPLQDLSEPALKFFKGVLTGSLFEGDEGMTAPLKR